MSPLIPMTIVCGADSLNITTKRGRPVRIRPLLPEDAPLLVDLFYHLSFETRRLRFFLPMEQMSAEYVAQLAEQLANFNPQHGAALMATVQDMGEEHAVGVACLAREDETPTAAEIAIVIRDDYQGEGLGTVLLGLLVQVALARGLEKLTAETLPENRAVVHLVNRLGLPVTTGFRNGHTVFTVELSGV